MENIESIVFTLTRLANKKEEETKLLIEKYSKMSEIEIIKDLSMLSYKMFSSNEGFLNYALTLIRSINPKKCPPMEEMKIILKNMHTNTVENDIDLELNHNIINENLENFTTMFNDAEIDYYIVGALPCFIKIGEPLYRYHDDIEIMINEDDIEKTKETVELCGYEFIDDRYPTVERYKEIEQKKLSHIILAQHPENKIHLGIMCFRREKDNSITMREYVHHLRDNKVIVDIIERRYDKEGTNLRFDDNPVIFMNTSFKTCTIENVYHLKSNTKETKDISDMKKLEPHIDKEKLLSIEENTQKPVTLPDVKNKQIVNGIKKIES